MIKNIKVTNSQGELYILELRSPEKSGFFVRNIEGLGPTKSDINLDKSLYLDGDYYNSSRLNGRNIVLNLGFLDYLVETIEQIRNKTYRIFPMKKPLLIEVETDSRTGTTIGYVETNEPDIFSKEEGTTISIICPSSYFLDKNIVETTLIGVSGGFEFPFENPSLTLPLIEFGQIYINTNANLTYTGDIPTGVIIVISVTNSMATNLNINNVSEGTSMVIDYVKLTALTGSELIAGDIVTICTVPGNKYIHLLRGSTTWNILNALNANADWFTIDKGTTVFSVVPTAGLSYFTYSIFHQIVYGGM